MVRPSACLTQSSEENLLVLADVDVRNIVCGIVGEGVNSVSTVRRFEWRSSGLGEVSGERRLLVE